MPGRWFATVVGVLLACSVSCASGARLLVVPLASDIHILAFTALTTELERLGGHEIHMVVSTALADVAKDMATSRFSEHNHHYITYPFRFEVFADDMAKIARANPIVAMHYGYKVMAAMTEMVIGDQQLIQQFKDLKPDLIIGDATASYGHWLSAKLGVPSIEFDVGTSSGLLHSGGFGGQLNPAYIPASGTFYPSTGMSLYQRCINVAHLVATKVMSYTHKNFGPVHSMARRQGIKHLPGQGPHKPLLLLVNFDWALEPPRPVAPNTKYLGVLMPKPPKKVPDHILDWLEHPNQSSASKKPSATDHNQINTSNDAVNMPPSKSNQLPVVYLSFGASFVAPEAAIPALAASIAATKHKIRFILRMGAHENGMLSSAWSSLGVQVTSDEVLVLPHAPQNDLLGHPAVAAFVTQGGYLSIQEAAYHGVPVIGIPLMLGHNELVSHAQDHGRGILVRKETLMAGNPDALTAALLEVVNNNSYKQQAAITAARLKAHPVSPGQQATDWVDYALAAAPGQGSFLHTQGQDMYWWQVILLDVLLMYGMAAWLLSLLVRQAARTGFSVILGLTSRRLGGQGSNPTRGVSPAATNGAAAMTSKQKHH